MVSLVLRLAFAGFAFCYNVATDENVENPRPQPLRIMEPAGKYDQTKGSGFLQMDLNRRQVESGIQRGRAALL